MAQSIQVYHYEFPLSLGEIFNKLDNKKTIPETQKNKNNPDEEITVKSTISELKRHTFGIVGYLKYGFQKENEFRVDGGFDITHREFNFLISPSSKVIILHGPQDYRIRVLELLSKILHDGDELFHPILITKENMYKLMKKIIAMSTKNNLEEGKFKHSARPYTKLKKLSFGTIPDFCGTDHPLFIKHYDNCSHWACAVRIYRCNGILDNASQTGQILRIGLYATFSLTIDAELSQWNRFIFETCKDALEL